MEDEELPDTKVDDVVSRMEAALAAAEGKEAPERSVPLTAEEKKSDDGW